MADAAGLNPAAERRGGSSPSSGTTDCACTLHAGVPSGMRRLHGLRFMGRFCGTKPRIFCGQNQHIYAWVPLERNSSGM